MSGDPLTLTLPPELVDAVAEKVAAILEALMRPAAPARWMTVEEAAEYLRCSRQRVYDLRSSGRLSRTGDGSRVLVDRLELDKLIQGGGVR